MLTVALFETEERSLATRSPRSDVGLEEILDVMMVWLLRLASGLECEAGYTILSDAAESVCKVAKKSVLEGRVPMPNAQRGWYRDVVVKLASGRGTGR